MTIGRSRRTRKMRPSCVRGTAGKPDSGDGCRFDYENEVGMNTMNTTTQMPTDRCDECGQMKPAFGFTHRTSEAAGAAQKLCSACCNSEYMHRAGLPDLETVDFEPLARR